ncbi:putative alpha-1,6-mannanase (GH76 family) [Microbacterium sp. 1154]|uniref:glycoside hydrolase family 76 protein n=1 Tax=Microbacterium sp. 1154 TaxID=2817733 RepID=UPI002857E2DA|nr:glycoside hydrolase family 76 protein [Microbacterium sp. 1154]MDR6690490.1 putative alpha-1,6-mannanase (GH76 family) [Microbacterium sp. 1154]
MDADTPAQQRAAAAERAVLDRYLHRYGPVAWAHAAVAGRENPRMWHYWWHAHLLHVLADAETHRPDARRRRLIRRVARGVTLRTIGRWTTPFYDDIAWMGLALAQSGRHPRALRKIARILADAVDPSVGALPWSVGSELYNAPANAPGGMVLALTGRRAEAAGLAAWMASVLDEPTTHLVRDGIEHGVTRSELWTYNQGAVIGLELMLAEPALADPTHAARAHVERARALVRAVERWCAGDDGLFPAAGGGDGGLFAGILARYLTQAARDLATGTDAEGHDVARTARRLVERNADALWAGRRNGLFAADPRRPARAEGDDLDLSVQLGAWITLEAAAGLERAITS